MINTQRKNIVNPSNFNIEKRYKIVFSIPGVNLIL